MFLLFWILLACVFRFYVCVLPACMWATDVPSAQGGQRKVLHPLELELQTVVNCLCVLGTKPVF